MNDLVIIHNNNTGCDAVIIDIKINIVVVRRNSSSTMISLYYINMENINMGNLYIMILFISLY